MNKTGGAAAAAAAAPAAGVGGGYSLADVAKHNTKTDCWVVVNGEAPSRARWPVIRGVGRRSPKSGAGGGGRANCGGPRFGLDGHLRDRHHLAPECGSVGSNGPGGTNFRPNPMRSFPAAFWATPSPDFGSTSWLCRRGPPRELTFEPYPRA